MRLGTCVAVFVLVGVAGSPPPAVAVESDTPLYTVKDLGPGTPVGLNESGQVAKVRYLGQTTDANPSGRFEDLWASYVGTPTSDLGPYTFEAAGGTGLGNGSVRAAGGLSDAGTMAAACHAGYDGEDGSARALTHACRVGAGPSADLGLPVHTNMPTGSALEVQLDPSSADGFSVGLAISPNGTVAGITKHDVVGVARPTDYWNNLGSIAGYDNGGVYVDASSYRAAWDAANLPYGHVHPFRGDALSPLMADELADASVHAVNSGGVIAGIVGGRAATISGSGHRTLDSAGNASAAYAINDRGDVAGSRTENRVVGSAFLEHAVLWTSKGTVELPGFGPDDRSRALGMDETGRVVGWVESGTSSVVSKNAVVWTDGQVANLNDVIDNGITRSEAPYDYMFFRVEEAVAINERGQILCLGYDNANGAARAFLLTPVCTTLEALPRVLDFGDIQSGTTATLHLDVRNCTTASGGIVATGGGTSFRRTGAAKVVAAPGASARFTIEFRPKRVGAFSDVLTFSGPNRTRITVEVRGTGTPVQPQLLVFPSPFTFGTSVRGATRYPVFVQNLRNEPVRVTYEGLAPPFRLVGPKTATFPARGRGSFEIEFDPRAAANALTTPEFSASMEIRTNVKGAPVQTFSATAGVARTAKIKSLKRGLGGGSVEARKLPGDWADLEVGTELGEGYEIATDPEGEVEVEFVDGTTAVLGPSSQIKLNAFFSQGGVVQTEILLTVGRIAAKVAKPSIAKSDFKVRPPSSVASVRGTDFDVIHDDATGTSTIRVREGVVEVDPVTDGLKTVKVKAGRQVSVSLTAVGRLLPYKP